jgi:hypothetical protein
MALASSFQLQLMPPFMCLCDFGGCMEQDGARKIHFYDKSER